MSILDTTPSLEPKDLETTEVKPEEAKPEQKLPELDKLACGYVVGLDPSGELVFEIIGEQPGLVQLLGLHTYAGNRLDIASDINLNYGIPLLAKQIAEIQQILSTILKMQTTQAKASMSTLIKGK